MSKISFIGKYRYLGMVVIIMQGVLFALLTIFSLDSRYQRQWEEFPNSQQCLEVYIKNIPIEKNDEVGSFFYQTAVEKNLLVIRKDMCLQNKGSFGGYIIGVCGNIDKQDISFSFLGTQIINGEQIRKLLHSDNQENTLGIKNGSVNTIGDIPSFRFGNRVVIEKMEQLVDESKTINGTYFILGLDNEKKEDFLQDLSEVSGLSIEDIAKKTSGVVLDNSLKETICFGLILGQMFLNIIFFLVVTIRNLSKGGKLALLGWSRRDFCWELLGVFVEYAVIGILIQVVFGVAFSDWGHISTMFVSNFMMYALVNFVLIIMELAVSAMVIMTISSINAIHGRIPKKILYVIGIIAYAVVSIAIVFSGCKVDGPMEEIVKNKKISKRWDNVSEYQVLKSISVGEDGNTFSGQSNELNQNVFDWYKSIASEEGVYLINTLYYDSSTLQGWKVYKSFENVPMNPFWYFTLSPNYIEKLGIDVDEECLSNAINGTRTYLVPSTMTEQEKEKMMAWLKEFSEKNIKEGDIETTFNKNRDINMITYTPTEQLFTWAVNEQDSIEVQDPVIYICTPENMKYFESESLKTSGFDGYIKFINEETGLKYTDNVTMSKYNLSDNQIVFADVEVYIDGLQKSLKNTIAWFGLVFLILLLVLIGILIALASIFRIVNQEKINVKKFLGFSFSQIYRAPVTLLSISMGIEILVTLMMRSKFGLLFTIITGIIQGIIFKKYMSKCEMSEILKAFKGE